MEGALVSILLVIVTFLVFFIDSSTRSKRRRLTNKKRSSSDEDDYENFCYKINHKQSRFFEMLDRVFPDGNDEDGKLCNNTAKKLAEFFLGQARFAKRVEGNWNELIYSNPNLNEVVDQNGCSVTVKDFQENFLEKCQKLINLGLADDNREDDYWKILNELQRENEDMRKALNNLAEAANNRSTPEQSRNREIVEAARANFNQSGKKDFAKLADRWLILMEENPNLGALSGTASVFQYLMEDHTEDEANLFIKATKLVDHLEILGDVKKKPTTTNDLIDIDIDSWQEVVDNLIKKS